MNIGFIEALKIYDFDCFVFHDVDLVPEDDRYGMNNLLGANPINLKKIIKRLYSVQNFGAINTKYFNVIKFMFLCSLCAFIMLSDKGDGIIFLAHCKCYGKSI